MEEINLLQNRVKDTTFAWQKQSRLISSILWVVLILVAGGIAAFFLLSKNLTSQKEAVIKTNVELQKQLSEKQLTVGSATAFQAQLLNLKTLVNTHTYLSPLLDELSKSTYIKSQFMSLDVIQSGKIHIEARAASYADIGKLILGLNTADGKFKNVRLLSVQPASGTENAYQFSLNLEVDPVIFTKK